MSLSQTISAAPSAQSRSLVSASAGAVSTPWNIWLMVFGIVITAVGAIVDLAWHMSIGRDAFWTPGHFMIGLGGGLVGIACLYEIAVTTWSGASGRRDVAARILGLHGPGGAFLAAWGSLGMLASAPFDDWWHNAYGLDLRFITPPHMLLMIGYLAAKIGAMTWMASMINRSSGELRERLVWLFLIVGAISVLHMPMMNLTARTNMHTAACYLAVALAIPSVMISTGRAS